MFGITAVGVATTGYFMSLGSVGLFVLSAIALRLALTDYKLPVLIILIAALLALSLCCWLGASIRSISRLICHAPLLRWFCPRHFRTGVSGRPGA